MYSGQYKYWMFLCVHSVIVPPPFFKYISTSPTTAPTISRILSPLSYEAVKGFGLSSNKHTS